MIIPISEEEVYVVLGIDENEHDQVLGVFYTFERAKRFCIKCECKTAYYDLWIEKHLVN